MPFTDVRHILDELRRPDPDLTIWSCDECGSLVIDIGNLGANRAIHERWHESLNRSLNELSPDFQGV